MHPLLRSAKQFAILGLLASPICFIIVFLMVSLVGMPWGDAALWIIPPVIVELFFCLSTWYFCRSTFVYRWRWNRIIWTHAVISLILTGLWGVVILVYSWLLNTFFKSDTYSTYFIHAVPVLFAIGISLYFIAVLAHYLVLVVERHRLAEEEVLKQKLMKGEAELRALKATVHPHFLFNSLNLLNPLMRTSIDKAQQVVSQLSDFLLYSLHYGNKDQVTLRDEIQHIDNYLEIEKIRLEHRLQVEKKVDETLLDTPVLPLTLLPLMENAIKHGIGQCLEGGVLSISIQKERDVMVIEISNPFDQPTRPLRGTGMGLETLRQRFRTYYGRDARLTVQKEENRFRVLVRIPLKREV